MLAKHLEKKEQEGGFTLVELLVVILIIGILAAVAIPAFLNQRKRANDAAVESDVKNLATQIESALIADPNASTISAAESSGTVTVTVGSETVTATLSDGVSVEVVTSSTNTSGVDANGYTIHGWHSNGDQYTANSSGNRLEYISDKGGLQ